MQIKTEEEIHRESAQDKVWHKTPPPSSFSFPGLRQIRIAAASPQQLCSLQCLVSSALPSLGATCYDHTYVIPQRGRGGEGNPSLSGLPALTNYCFGAQERWSIHKVLQLYDQLPNGCLLYIILPFAPSSCFFSRYQYSTTCKKK